MYRTFQISVVFSLLISWHECRPAERAETSRSSSPADLITDVKEGLAYNLIQKRIIDSVHPKPIVDTMTEEEKYGNNNQHPIGKFVLKGAEGVSRAVNSAFTIPKEVSNRAANRLRDVLNDVGGKLVGLQ